MNEIIVYKDIIFESIKHIDESGNEYWLARELQIVLDYKKWQKFINVIESAKISCKQSNFIIDDHFTQVGKMVDIGSRTSRSILDYKLSRYACYLIVQNSDSRKEVVALGQTYFAIQTRKQEITEQEYDSLSDDEKRFYQIKLTRQGDIFKRKKLRYREDILDNMNEDELVANLFRINQTKQKLLKDNVQGEKEAKDVHYEVGQKVRKAIADIGGMMPEEMPTPKKSLKELERERKKLEIKEQKKLEKTK